MKEKYVMIVEKGSDALQKNESLSQQTKKFLLSGIFTEFDIKNRNQRFYNANNFIPVMNNLLERKKTLGVLYGEFDHPDVFDIAGKNASHAIDNLTHNESANRVDGSIQLLSTHWGKEARAIISDGLPLFVSSRAAGVTDGQGHVQLKELFTYDIVLDPGFASAQVCVNESFGYKSTDEVKYRIYEMNDSQVNKLFNDNKNDRKTSMDLNKMEQFLADEMAKLEHKIMSSIEGKNSPEEVRSLMEKYEAVNSDLNKVHEYLDFLKTKVNYLVKENTKLVSENSKLVQELNENTAYSNHIATQVKKFGTYTKDIESRLGLVEKFSEYTAEHVKANIMFTESIAQETEITQKFAEHIALETELTQKFAEHVAKETDIAQKFAEHIALESYKDEVFLNYIGEKVDGLIDYNGKMLERIKKSTPLNENISDEDNIQGMESAEDFLGLPEEQEVANNIENTDASVEAPPAGDTPPAGDEAGVPEVTDDVTGADAPIDQPGVPPVDMLLIFNLKVLQLVEVYLTL
jgi:regulator of replication initiation timing